MVAHHYPGVNTPAGLFAALGQRFQPEFSVLVIGINITALVSACRDVVNRPGVFNSNLASHCARLPQTPVHRRIFFTFPGLTLYSTSTSDFLIITPSTENWFLWFERLQKSMLFPSRNEVIPQHFH